MGHNRSERHLYPVRGRLLQGAPLRVVPERVAMQGRTLRWLASRIDRSRPYYLLGEVEMADARAQARIATLSSIETYNHPFTHNLTYCKI